MFEFKINERVCGNVLLGDNLRMEGVVLKEDAGISRDAIVVTLDNGDIAVMLSNTVMRIDNKLTEDQKWLLERIEKINNWKSQHRLATHRTIWQGSYDVWNSLEDMADNQIIPKQRMEESESLGLIKKKIHIPKNTQYEFEVWFVTDFGKEMLEKSMVK